MESEDVPYKTTLLNGLWEVGDIGVRIVGILWLIGAIIFICIGIGIVTSGSWWSSVLLYGVLYSLLLCIFGWPDARIGFWVNVIILAFLGIWLGSFTK